MKLVSIHIRVILLFLSFAFFPYSQGRAQTMTLEQCVDTALVFNRTLQMGRNDQSLSRLRRREARANLLPKATAGADYRYFTHLPTQLLPLEVFNGPEGMYKDAQFGVPHNIGANVQLAMPLYNPQIKGGIQTAEIAGKLSDLQYRKSEEQVIFEVTNLYYNAQILHYQLNFIDSNLTNVNRLLVNMELLREQGLAKGTDVGKLQLQGEQLSAQRAQAESKLEQILNGLKFLMGVSLDRPLSVQTEIARREAVNYPASPSLDLQIVQTRNRLLANELNTLEKSKLPSVSLLANYGLTGFGYGRQPEPFLKFFPVGFVGVRAAYTIWDGTTRLQIEQKRMELRNNVLQSDQIRAQNDLSIANAVLQRGTAERSIQTSSQQIELAQTVYRQTVLQQQQGTAALADVLLADNALREAQQNYLNAIIEYLKADLELKKAAGSINQ
jgi:OMF family outer membrane factor